MSLDLVAATAYFTCGALLLFLGFVVLRENPRQAVNRATCGMLLFGGLAPILGAYSSLTSGLSPDRPLHLSTDVFREYAFLWEFFFPTVLLFALVFPSRHALLKRWPRAGILLFVPHFFHVFLVMVLTGPIGLLDRLDPQSFPWGGGAMAQSARLAQLGVDLVLQVHVRFFSFINLGMAVGSWMLLMWSSRRTTNPKLRSQVRVIALGLGISLALYSGGELIPTVFGLALDRRLGLPLVTVSLLTGAASIVVAIVRLQFLDVRFIVRRGLVYGLASGVIVALYLFVGKQIDRFSAGFVGQQIPVFETTFLVLSLFLLQPVLGGIERLVDRAYSRDRTDLRNALNRLSARVSLSLDPAEVCETVASTLKQEMVIESAAVVTRGSPAHRPVGALARGESVEALAWAAPASFYEALSGRETVPAAELCEAPDDADDREAVTRELERIGADFAIPLTAASAEGEGEVVGAMILGPKITQTRYTFEEMSLLSLVAHQVGISLKNGSLHKEQIASRLLEEEMATARSIQKNLVPDTAPALSGWEIHATSRPSREVGGDYHDFLPLGDGRLGIAIGDVSGKGVPAALLMSNLQAALRVGALRGEETARMVADVNRHLCKTTGPDSFITFFLGRLEPGDGTFAFTNAGHNAPVVVRADGTVETLEDGGLILGVFSEAEYERGSVRLEPGDAVAFYTDGVTEAENGGGELFSEDRLVQALLRHRGASAREMHDRILDEVREFQEGRVPDDDLTLMLLRRSPNGGAA